MLREAKFRTYYEEACFDECWLWEGALTHNGYGRFRVGNTHKRAHRITYELYKDRIPKGALVTHTCDNPTCINPQHLSIGTQKNNMQEMIRRGRGGAAALTLAKIKRAIQFYRAGVTQKDLVAVFGVNQSAISRLVNGKTYGFLHKEIAIEVWEARQK